MPGTELGAGTLVVDTQRSSLAGRSHIPADEHGQSMGNSVSGDFYRTAELCCATQQPLARRACWVPVPGGRCCVLHTPGFKDLT